MLKFLPTWKQARKLKAYREMVLRLKAVLPGLKDVSNEELRERFQALKGTGAAFDGSAASLLPEALALVSEAAFRALGLRPYDVQLMGGMVLAHGAVAEMGTGEGKTLVAPFAVAVHYLQGRPVHLSTLNEYLASRDANMMMGVYHLLGLSVGVCRGSQSLEDKQLVYSCDVVYGTHHVFAQDYLNDHLVRNPNQRAQVRGLGFAIVDEADSVLIDDARTPVVLSASRPVQVGLYESVARIAERLTRTTDDAGEGDFWVDGVARQAVLTDAGYDRVTALLQDAGLLSGDVADGLYDTPHQQQLLRVVSALSAMHVLHRDQHYVVQAGEIVLVDELTGRLLPGRRWDAGLQQALEAKEGLEVSPESVMLARLTLQSYFKLYQGLSGMTGTASMEAEELLSVYGLDVVTLPPNRPAVRVDEADKFFRTQGAKLDAVVSDIAARHALGQPVLVGTASVDQSIELAARLTDLGLPHEVLNASQHAREAEIIAMAGAPGAITVSTNMAGRGVDIVLGGSVGLAVYLKQVENQAEWERLPESEIRARVAQIKQQVAVNAEAVRQAGGLHIIGMERYESRRMDLQLRGRAGRQGDPGSSCFYISMQDPLVENFAGETIRAILATLDIPPGDEFEIELVSKAIDSAQRQAEGRAQDARKSLVQYDQVFSDQREVFYALREFVLTGEGLSDWLIHKRAAFVDVLLETYAPAGQFSEKWNLSGLRGALSSLELKFPSDEELRDLEWPDLQELLGNLLALRHAVAASQVPEENLVNAERFVALGALDRHWFAHIEELEGLRQGIHLRGHAKVDPKQAYAKEAFELFARMLSAAEAEVVMLVLGWRLADDPVLG